MGLSSISTVRIRDESGSPSYLQIILPNLKKVSSFFTPLYEPEAFHLILILLQYSFRQIDK